MNGRYTKVADELDDLARRLWNDALITDAQGLLLGRIVRLLRHKIAPPVAFQEPAGEPIAFDLMVMLDVPGREVWDVEDTVRSREEADEWLRGAPDREHYRVVPLYSAPPVPPWE